MNRGIKRIWTEKTVFSNASPQIKVTAPMSIYPTERLLTALGGVYVHGHNIYCTLCARHNINCVMWIVFNSTYDSYIIIRLILQMGVGGRSKEGNSSVTLEQIIQAEAKPWNADSLSVIYWRTKMEATLCKSSASPVKAAQVAVLTSVHTPPGLG